MQDFEKLGVFYLGRRYDLAAKTHEESLLLYDSRHLTTHAVCVGMTGSGKTGLCLSLLEEAAIDGIPTLAIDPKGDLGNLLLNFPELAPADFVPWVDPQEASKKGLSTEALAAETAATWRAGLAEHGQDVARIRRLRESAEVTIYAPGSSAGVPLALLPSFVAPTGGALAAKRKNAEEKVERERREAQAQTVDAALSFGSSVLGALFGRKTLSSANVSRARSTLKSANRTLKERGDVAVAEETIEAVAEDVADLELELEAEVTKITASFDPEILGVEKASVAAKKADTKVESIALAWIQRS